MSLYVYCVLETAQDVPAIRGMQDQSVNIRIVDDLPLIVSEFRGTELLPTKENVFTHERVIEACMKDRTPLPFRFGVVVSDEKLVEFITKNAEALKRSLADVRGCVEIGIKVMVASPPSEPSLTGTDFLKGKQRKLDLQKEIAAWVDARLAGLVRRTEVSSVPGTAKAIIRIAHLVLREHLTEYNPRVDAMVRERTEWAFLRSGPWPPYSFISTPGAG